MNHARSRIPLLIALIGLMVMALVIGLMGCGGSTTTSAEQSTTTGAEQSTTTVASIQ